MSALFSLDSPSIILAQAESIGLSEEQKQKLFEVDKEARQEARSVLTAEQTKNMWEIPDEPMAIMEMCQQMCGVIAPMTRMMMGGQAEPQGSKPDGDKWKIDCGSNEKHTQRKAPPNSKT